MTRSIAEIIGYHADWPDGSANYKVWWKDGRQMPLTWSPTADDLLAWLREQAVEIRAERPLTDDLPFFEVFRYDVNGDDLEAHVGATTLLEALEMAVRAVAGES